MKLNRLRFTPSVIPNLFTAMNMFCGFLSIISTSDQQFIYASWLIIVAGLFDALDGAVARLTKSSSELGIELDSLADVVSFGAAPAFLIYKAHLFQYGALGVVISSLILLAGGFRLARFNVQLVGFEKSFFKGLPIPTSAATIVSFILVYYEPGTGLPKPFSDLVVPLILLLSFLMVSTIKYDTIPVLNSKSIKEKPFHFIFIFVSLILIIATLGKAIFFIFVFIILFGIFRYIYSLLFNKKGIFKNSSTQNR